ncbi:MAG: phosphoglucosamine mutase, partial [Burkholderiales bacterium]
MSERLFGTDGVRGKAGERPLDHDTVARLGAALVRAMGGGGRQLRFMVGRDTRESGEWIERELARGVRSEGAHITSAGVLPTPAVAYVTREMAFDAGLVISASHNPFQDNGIKVFSGRGEKFTEALERRVEDIIADATWRVSGSADVPVDRTDVVDAYIAHARLAFPNPERLGGFKIAVDTANGATTTVAPQLFRELGFDVELLSASPDGRNINLECGSTHPQHLARVVVERGCRAGVAFDGDGDRAILVDANGRLVDGDAVLLMCGRHLHRTGELKGDAVVATVMSNIGLEIALKESGIEMVRCPVGDKYVMEEMIKRGLSLGGEQSGHVIFSDHLFTGDGIVTALSVLRVMADTGRELADLASELVTYPQVLLNVRVREKRDLRSV